MDISFAQAVLGDSIEVPTPHGPKILELPRGTRSGQNFVFPGLGVPEASNCRAGHLIVTVQITHKASVSDAETRAPGWTRKRGENK
jgi:molecular chaperone DnaJ